MRRRLPRLLRSAALLAALTVSLFACRTAPDPPPPPPPPPPTEAPPPEPVAQGAAEGEMCGGIAGIPCQEGLWCDPEPGFCDGADIAGTCIQVPEACTRDYRPVCGCDGQTYSNDCTRQAAKVAKNHDGACEEAAGETDAVN